VILGEGRLFSGEPARRAVAREYRERVWFERYGAYMIATLRGILKLRDPGRLIVETAGIGYEVFVPLNTYYRMPSVGAEVELEIRQIVREDALLLYGFAT
jgi:hypothetical protein